MKREICLPRRGMGWIRTALVVFAVLAFVLALREITTRRDAVLDEIQFCARELVADDPSYTMREAWILCAQEATPDQRG